MKIYQVNAKHLTPFYTFDHAAALLMLDYLKKYGPPCSIRALDPARAAWKISRPAR